jgi:hypothetical protein
MYDVSRTPALDRISEKALRFILTLGRLTRARLALEAAGMTPAHVREGLSLLRAVAGSTDEDDVAARESRRSDARRRLAVEGPALRLVGSVLDRLEALAADPRPLAAVSLLLLETRGLGTAHRRELATLVRCAEGDVAALAADADEPRRAARTEASLALYRWYQTWSMAARIAIADLAALGVVATSARAEARAGFRPETARSARRAA